MPELVGHLHVSVVLGFKLVCYTYCSSPTSAQREADGTTFLRTKTTWCRGLSQRREQVGRLATG